MRVDEAEDRFRAMLPETGLDVDRLEAHATWKVFKRFPAIPVDGTEPDPDNDMLLSEWRTCEWSGFDGLHVGWSLTIRGRAGHARRPLVGPPRARLSADRD
jgi:hypothetical protein